MELFKQNDHDKKLAICLVLVELLVKLQHLADVTTDSENFGYLMPEKCIQIIDFKVLKEMYYSIDYNMNKLNTGIITNINMLFVILDG